MDVTQTVIYILHGNQSFNSCVVPSRSMSFLPDNLQHFFYTFLSSFQVHFLSFLLFVLILFRCLSFSFFKFSYIYFNFFFVTVSNVSDHLIFIFLFFFLLVSQSFLPQFHLFCCLSSTFFSCPLFFFHFFIVFLYFSSTVSSCCFILLLPFPRVSLSFLHSIRLLRAVFILLLFLLSISNSAPFLSIHFFQSMSKR